MEQASATEPIERILQHGAADPDASIAGLAGARGLVACGATVLALITDLRYVDGV